MLHLLLGRDWTAVHDEMFRRISVDIQNKQGGRILLVPELISHEEERNLCAWGGDTSSRYAEVLSFTRLARRAAETAGSAAADCLDEGGRLVAMAAIAHQLASRLKVYAAVESKPDMLRELVDAIDEFKRCCISPQDLMAAATAAEGAFAQKLEELSLLMEGYNAFCSRGKRDPRDLLTWFLEQLEAGTYGQEHVFYINGFPDFTRQNMAILEHLICVSPCVTVGLNCDSVDSGLLAFEKAGETAAQFCRAAKKAGIPVKIEIIPEKTSPLAIVRDRILQGQIPGGAAQEHIAAYRAETPWAEVMAAANHIQQLVRSGCRYRDIAVVCPDMPTYQPLADLIFHRMHIPLYRSGTEEILQKSIIATVLAATDAAISDLDQREVFRYLRSALSGIDPDTCDIVENYAFMWGIRGSKWLTEWTASTDGLKDAHNQAHSDEKLKIINAARKKAMEPLAKLRKNFVAAQKLADQVLAVYNFLEDIHLASRLSELADELDAEGDNRGAQILNQLWEILIGALEQMHDALGDTHWEAEHFAALFRLLLSQYDVGTIPPVLDAVHMGPVSAMRCNSQKHLILIGLQEGNFPAYSGSAGVFSDQERVALRNMGVPLTGGAMEGVQEEFAEIYGVICGATDTITAYCSGEQPSYIFRRLEDLAGGKAEADSDTGFAMADAKETAAWLAGLGAESAARRLNIASEFTDVMQQTAYSLGTVAPENIRLLYGDCLRLSASQVDTFAECKMSYFLRYGLRAAERKEITVDPAEFGTYVHWVLEQTVREIRDLGGFHQITLDQTRQIAHRYSEEYAAKHFNELESERMTYLFRRNMRELDMVVEDLWEELSQSEFQPKECEVNFDDNQDAMLAPIVIPNNSIPAMLRGFVDRVDVWNSNGNSYFRVVDYKTGKKAFDYCDVYNGIGLQMLLYLFALQQGGADWLKENPIPAGVLYFPARAPYLPLAELTNPVINEKEREKQRKRSGLLLNDAQILQAMEPGDTIKRMCYSVKKDGQISGDVADREQFQLLKRHVYRILGRFVDEIASGSVEPNPYTRGQSHDACRFCPYGTVCHKQTVAGRRNYQGVKADQFWDDLEKEMKKDG